MPPQRGSLVSGGGRHTVEEGGCRGLQRGATAWEGCGGNGGRRWQRGETGYIEKNIKDNGSSFLTIRKGSYNYEKGQH